MLAPVSVSHALLYLDFMFIFVFVFAACGLLTCNSMFLPHKRMRVPRHLRERQCQNRSIPPWFVLGHGTKDGIAMMCVAFLACFDTLKLHTPKSASLGDRLRNAFRFSPCHLPPYLVPAPATFRASETQAAPGREKRSIGPPWVCLLTRRCTMVRAVKHHSKAL
ncbi:hypothetical protein V8C40DRAFT_256641 [Trichoderma camerunense]